MTSANIDVNVNDVTSYLHGHDVSKAADEPFGGDESKRNAV